MDKFKYNGKNKSRECYYLKHSLFNLYEVLTRIKLNGIVLIL